MNEVETKVMMRIADSLERIATSLEEGHIMVELTGSSDGIDKLATALKDAIEEGVASLNENLDEIRSEAASISESLTTTLHSGREVSVTDAIVAVSESVGG